MGLPLTDLERGTGEWENIQEVLRGAFADHEQQLGLHHARLAATEKLSQEVEIRASQTSEKLAKIEGLPAHVDALARVVNALSEELKQRTQDEQERHRQQAKWIESVSRAVEAQLQALQARVISDVESVCGKAMGKMERRIELVEEELGHLVVALERKVDVDVIKAHRREVEEALKQRCRKVAFDKEVMRVHQLLKGHHSAVDERLESIQNSLKSQIEAQIRIEREIRVGEVESATLQRDKHEQQLRVEILATTEQSIRCAVEKAGKLVDDKVDTACTKIMHEMHEANQNLETRLGELVKRDEVIDVHQSLSQLRADWLESRQHIETATMANSLKIASMEDHQQALAAEAGDQLIKFKHEISTDREQMEQRISIMVGDFLKLETELKTTLNEIKSLEEDLSTMRRDLDRQTHELNDQMQEATKARDKKTRHQMHLVADKLSEMDQIMKLVGKQLVQNTSQLQLLWIEQDASTSGALCDDPELKLLIGKELEPAEVDLRDMDVESSTQHISREGDELDERHQQLQATVEAKLHDYQDLFSFQNTPKSGTQ